MDPWNLMNKDLNNLIEDKDQVVVDQIVVELLEGEEEVPHLVFV
jgi:hypothetical protein